MKKAIVFILLCCTLSLLISTPGFAELFNLDGFNTDNYDVNYDDIWKTGSIYSSLVADSLLDGIYTKNGKAQILPSIDMIDNSGWKIELCFAYMSKMNLFIKSIICIVDDKIYNFQDVPNELGPEDDGTFTEFAVIYFGSKSYPMLKTISDNPENKVIIRLVTNIGDQNFLLTPFAKSQIKLIYDSYVSAGGMNQLPAQLSSIESLATVVNVKSKDANRP